MPRGDLVRIVAMLAIAYIAVALLRDLQQPLQGVSESNRGLLSTQAGQQMEGTLPSYFKWKESLLTPVRDQAKCSSCWAFGSTSAFADTLAVMSGGAWQTLLSPQYLMSCTKIGYGCAVGGSPEDIFINQDIIDNGIPLESTFPYTASDDTACNFDTTKLRIRLVAGTGVDLCRDPAFALPGFGQRVINKNILNMKAAIVEFGPILGTLKITRKLIHYNAAKEGIFEEDFNAPSLGEHCIEIIGWCDENVNMNEPGFKDYGYWIIRNSYGGAWGLPPSMRNEKHFAYIRMGVNQNLIESRASICRVVVPACLQEAVANNDITTCAYTSYTDYVNDPEHSYFIEELEEARGGE